MNDTRSASWPGPSEAKCGHCGYEGSGLAHCPLCGARMIPLAVPPGGRARGASSAGDRGAAALEEAGRGTGVGPGSREEPGFETTGPGPHERPAWEDESVPFPANLLRTWVESVLEPGRFFRGVPWEEPAARPLLYFLIIHVTGALFALWWSAVFSTPGMEWLSDLGLVDAEPGAGSALLGFFVAPFAALVGLIFWTLSLHLLVALMAAERRSLRATVRALCYASGPSLFNVVPFVGGLVGFIWMLVLMTIGIREGHRMTTGAAALAVVLALLVPVFLLVALAFLVAGTLVLSV